MNADAEFELQVGPEVDLVLPYFVQQSQRHRGDLARVHDSVRLRHARHLADNRAIISRYTVVTCTVEGVWKLSGHGGGDSCPIWDLSPYRNQIIWREFHCSH